ncbi:single-stranded DNA-binding protein [Nocardia sp. NPDC052001]|uniref:single-stranded DNA-binding protein n=1 Tax=Nocardia sp. NPDC052001 TaxID=3154853 RepID=UPI00342F3646
MTPGYTVIGNLTGDPELRFTPAGEAVANFTVASTPRYFDRTTGQWRDGDALFLRCSIWRHAAENVAESLRRGARVIASGRLRQRTYQTREGDKRSVIELDVIEVGPSLLNATATVRRNAPTHGAGFGPHTDASNGFRGHAEHDDTARTTAPAAADPTEPTF